MKVIDTILLEWSYRCPDGIVDLNDPNKAKILFEILKPLLKEDIDDDILNVLTNIDDAETKDKVLKYLQSINQKEEKVEDKLEENITQKLEAKNITDSLTDLIIHYSTKYKNLKEVSDYLNNPTVTHSNLLSNNNLTTLFEPIKLSDSYKNKIINLAGSVGNVAVGKGEIALVMFLKYAEKYKAPKKPKKSKNAETEPTEVQSKGDIKVENVVLEVKRGESILAPTDYTKRATKSNLFGSGKAKDFVDNYNIDTKVKSTWVSQITSVDADEKEIKEVIKEIYPGLSIDFNEVNMQSAEEVNTAIGLALAKEYLKDKKLLFINDQNEYACIENYNSFEQLVRKKDISFKLASDSIPRTIYKGQSESTTNESIEEDNDDTI